MSYEEIIRENLDIVEESSGFREFVEKSFDDVLRDKDVDPREYQSRAAITGETFEVCLKVLFEEIYNDIEFIKGVSLDEAAMSRGGGADFAVMEEGCPKAIIEAKGTAGKLLCPDGEIVESSRPGLQRTDTVKKGVSQAYQAKSAYPNCQFYIITSHEPNGGNASKILEMAEGDIIDSVVSIDNRNEFREMISEIKDSI